MWLGARGIGATSREPARLVCSIDVLVAEVSPEIEPRPRRGRVPESGGFLTCLEGLLSARIVATVLPCFSVFAMLSQLAIYRPFSSVKLVGMAVVLG